MRQLVYDILAPLRSEIVKTESGLPNPPRFQRKLQRRSQSGRGGYVGTFRSCWLPFVDTYRTLCLTPTTGLRKILEGLRAGAPEA